MESYEASIQGDDSHISSCLFFGNCNMRHFILAMFIILVGLCSCKKKGCTDSLALNYSESAEKSDGSCVYPTNVRIISVELYFDSINNETGLTWDESSFADTRITVYRLDQAPFNNNPMFSFLSDTIFEKSLCKFTSIRGDVWYNNN